METRRKELTSGLVSVNGQSERWVQPGEPWRSGSLPEYEKAQGGHNVE